MLRKAFKRPLAFLLALLLLLLLIIIIISIIIIDSSSSYITPTSLRREANTT